jgi:hypothetical protein
MSLAKIVFGALMVFIVGLVLVLPAKAVENSESTNSGSVCDRLTIAWNAKKAGYERAREIRKKAFESTEARWGKLFEKLDGKSIETAVVRADADDAAFQFDALIAADDALFAAMESYGKANCDKSGVADARAALKTAQEGRRTARQAYTKSLRQLMTDLAKTRSTESTTNSTK